MNHLMEADMINIHDLSKFSKFGLSEESMGLLPQKSSDFLLIR